MPEAPVQEYGQLRPGEHVVGPAFQARNRRQVNPVPQTFGVEQWPHVRLDIGTTSRVDCIVRRIASDDGHDSSGMQHSIRTLFE